jgi:hypothetical protein
MPPGPSPPLSSRRNHGHRAYSSSVRPRSNSACRSRCSQSSRWDKVHAMLEQGVGMVALPVGLLAPVVSSPAGLPMPPPSRPPSAPAVPGSGVHHQAGPAARRLTPTRTPPPTVPHRARRRAIFGVDPTATLVANSDVGDRCGFYGLSRRHSCSRNANKRGRPGLNRTGFAGGLIS